MTFPHPGGQAKGWESHRQVGKAGQSKQTEPTSNTDVGIEC